MSPFVKHVVQELGTLRHEDKPGVGQRRVMAEAAERLLVDSESLLQGLKYEAYAVASGHEVEVRARVKGPGVKRFTVHRKWSAASGKHELSPECVIASVVAVRWDSSVLAPEKDGAKDQQENAARYKAVECVRAQLLKDCGQGIRAVLSGLQPDRDSQLKAQTQQHANRARSNDSAKRFAMERLSETMKTYDFSEEDVLEAWRMAAVGRVMTS